MTNSLKKQNEALRAALQRIVDAAKTGSATGGAADPLSDNFEGAFRTDLLRNPLIEARDLLAAPTKKQPPSLKLGTQTGSLINHVVSSMNDSGPAAGMGATKLYWSDRKACTIVKVFRNKAGKVIRIHVQEDHATRTDANGMSDSQSYKFAPNLEAAEEVFTLRSNGAWAPQGSSSRGVRLKIGARDQFHDYSF